MFTTTATTSSGWDMSTLTARWWNMKQVLEIIWLLSIVKCSKCLSGKGQRGVILPSMIPTLDFGKVKLTNTLPEMDSLTSLDIAYHI